VKFVSTPPLPEPQDQSRARVEAKAKEQRIISEGDDTVIVEDTSFDDEEKRL
jgi:translation initiation factor IF-1